MTVLRRSSSNAAILFALMLVLVVPLVFTACGPRRISYGVVVWPPETGDIAAGALVDVIAESQLNATYTVTHALAAQPLVLDLWRVETFRNLEERDQFLSRFEPVADQFVVAPRQGSVVYAVLGRRDRVVYRLRAGERLKVLEAVEHGGSLWYAVLAADGTKGYVTDLAPAGADGTAVDTPGDAPADPNLALIGNHVWRPAYFLDMFRNQAFDLRQFRPEIGLRVNPSAGFARLTLPDIDFEYQFGQLERTADRLYQVADNSLQIRVVNEFNIVVQYQPAAGSYRSVNMVRISEDVEAVVAAEIDRRTALIAELREPTGAFISDAYGRIDIFADGRFNWIDYDRVPGRAIPAGAGTVGSILHDWFAARELRAAYAGVLSFRFDRFPADPAHFLFTADSQGLRLTFASADVISGNTVRAVPTNPIVMFFSRTATPMPGDIDTGDSGTGDSGTGDSGTGR